MSIQTILVYLPAEQTAATLIEAAIKVAAPHNAHVIGLHMIPALPLYGEFPGEISDNARDNFVHTGKVAADAIKHILEQSKKPEGVTCEWRCITEAFINGSERFLREVRAADLIIMGKFDDRAPDPWGDFAELALLKSGRPVLYVPPTAIAPHTIGERVFIAWNDTREATRAVFDALDLIKQAKVVRAVTFVSREDQREAAEASIGRLCEMLARHGVQVASAVNFCEHGTGEAIRAKLVAESCDLLIMGGYSHSRVREFIFGGTSRTVLKDMAVVTLMSH